MADITLANSTYSTGTNDTASTLVNNVTATDAQQYNGAASAIVGIETILGTGTTLKGSKADLVERLAVALNSDGTLKSNTTSAFDGTLPVSVGGTGATTFTDGAVLIGNSTGAVQTLAPPSTPKTLIHTGTAGADPVWGSGLVYQAPSSCGSGSSRSHEGTVTISANGNYSGIHFYTDFTLNSGVTMTVPAGKRRLVIIASGTITINGTIAANGAGGTGGGPTETAGGHHGTDQAAGGGDTANAQCQGGHVLVHGCRIARGGLSGTSATQISGGDVPLLADVLSVQGGAGGGCDDSTLNSGGSGGASIVLVAPTVILAGTATLNTSGSNGATGAGGGGAGNVYIVARSYTDSGATFTQTGGTGGTGGGSGAAGVKQILIYA